MNKTNPVVYFLIALGAFLYVLVRAIVVGITFDEYWSINYFAAQSVEHILNFTPCDANNHIINTLLIKLLFFTGTRSLFIARLPNVAAFFLYLYFSYKIVKEFLPGVIGYVALLLLIFNPFVLDFFGLARGYGLALGFQMVSIYYLLLFFRDKKTSFGLVTLVFGALSVLSNFSVLNYFLSVLFLATAIPVYLRKEFNVKKIIINNSIITGILFLIIYEPVRKLKVEGKLFYGGTTGFYSDTLISLTKYALYTPFMSTRVYVLLDVFLVLFLITLIRSFYHLGFAVLSPQNILLYTLILCCLSTISQHFLLHNLYLIDRTALLFYPLIIFVFCLSLHASGYWFKTIGFATAAAFGVNFFMHANFYKTVTWFFDAHTAPMLTWINKKGKEQNKVMKIGFSWPLGSSIAYYAEKGYYPFIQVKGSDPDTDLNYYILLDKYFKDAGYDGTQQKINTMHKDTVLTYKNDGIDIFTNLRQ